MKKITYLILLSAFLIGCDTHIFESIETKKGETLILNSLTGNVHKVTKHGLFELESISTDSQRKKTQPLNFTQSNLPGSDINIELTLRYLENHILYIVTLSKRDTLSKDSDSLKNWVKKIEKIRNTSNNKITLELTDNYGFKILEMPVHLSNMTPVVDSSGIKSSFTYQGKKKLTYPVYKIIEDWNFSWNFEYAQANAKK